RGDIAVRPELDRRLVGSKKMANARLVSNDDGDTLPRINLVLRADRADRLRDLLETLHDALGAAAGERVHLLVEAGPRRADEALGGREVDAARDAAGVGGGHDFIQRPPEPLGGERDHR